MNKVKRWKDSSNNTAYYFYEGDGKIIGQVHNIAHTDIWLAKIIFNYTEEKYLGQYVTQTFARHAIENFWEIEDRTLLD